MQPVFPGDYRGRLWPCVVGKVANVNLNCCLDEMERLPVSIHVA